MLRSLRKAAQSLERNMETAFSTAPPSRTAFVNKSLHINGHHIRLGQVFAEGGFSFLHTAAPASASSATRYAVKRLACPDEESRAVAQREIDFLNGLPEHPNIVQFYGGIFHDGHAFLMFDLVDGGTLPEVLSRSTQQTPERLLSILGDAAAAIAHLHAQDPPVAMRDVKLENLLYDRLAKCYKLCDFGSVSTFAGRFTTRKDILAAEDDIANSCTPMYRAPELVDLYAKEFICEEVDIWALGCVWHALLFGKLPFDGLSSLQILKGLAYLPEHPEFPEPYLQLLRRMLTVSPAERADAFEVLETVRRLQGRKVDPEVMQAASRVRERRSRDFGRDCERGIETDLIGEGGVPPVTENCAVKNSDNASLIDFSSFGVAAEQVSSAPNVDKKTAKNDDGWADFESAFGSGSSGMPKADSSTSFSHCRRGGVAPTSDSKTAATSLIDFTGFHISTPSGTPAPRPQIPSRPPRANPTKSAPDFSDLIDFGNQT